MNSILSVFILSAFFSIRVFAQSTDVSTLEPINELGKVEYKGYTGGLYPNGSNTMPSAFYTDAIAAASAVQPLDSKGNPSANGKVGLISIGPSTVFMFSEDLATKITRVPGINPKMTFINGGVPAQDLNKIHDQQAKYWVNVESRVAQAGLTNAQIQVAWVQEDDLRNTTSAFPERANMLVDEFTYLFQQLKIRYPNLQIIYLTGRHTTEYMPNDAKDKHQEPRAYYNGWAMKWLIEQQINGSNELSYKGSSPKVPLLMWGPYFWTQGSKTRDDGYEFKPDMVNEDGVHPNANGKSKVANDLLSFWQQDPISQIWFYGTGAVPPAITYFQINVGNNLLTKIDEKTISGNLKLMILKDTVVTVDQSYSHKNLEINVKNLGAGSWKYIVMDDTGIKLNGEFATDAQGNLLGGAIATTNTNVIADNSSPAWIINGKDRLSKLQRFFGDDREIKMEISDHNKKVVMSMEDVLHQHVDVNELVEPGKYCIKFYEKDGTFIDTTEVIPELVKIK